MNKKIFPRLLCLCLCSALLLAACQTPAAQRGNADPTVLPSYIRTMDFQEHFDISIGYWNIEGMAKSSEPDGMTAYIQELFNVTFHPVSVTWSNYKERYQILSATNSLPDIFVALTLSSNDNNDSATYADMIGKNSIRALPEDLSGFPLVADLLESVPYTRYSDGLYYALPRVSFTDEILGATDAAMLVRRDWMDHLGLSDPESFEDFAALTAAFASQDPDGNGLDDTIGYNVNTSSALGKWVILGIAPECNVYSWVEDNGRFVPSWTTDSFHDVVAAYRTLYETGGLDPQFYSKAPNTVLEDFAAGRLGALEYKSSPSSIRELKELWDAMNDKPMEECVDVLPVFPAPDGVRYSNSSNIFWSESYIASNVDDNKITRILAIYEFLLSEKGQEMCRYGIEGVDYQKLEDGSIQCLLETGEQSLSTVLMEKYPSFTLFSNLATWGGGWADFEENEINYLRYGQFATQLGHKSALWFSDNTTQLTRPYTFLVFPKEPTDRFTTSQAFAAFVNCIIGTEDPIGMWQQALEEMRSQGLEEYIDRQNANYEHWQALR